MIYIPLVDAVEYEVSVEELGRCGFIFEFMQDGNIICATRGIGEEFAIAEIRILDLNTNRFETIHQVEVYLDEPSERGLLGLLLEERDDTYVYLLYTYLEDDKQYKKVVRFEYDKEFKRLVNEKVLLDKIPASIIHNGGPMEFGPDGLLYITNGDADDFPPSRFRVLYNHTEVRFPDTLKGKILRIDRDGNIPDDNPFPGSPIYTIGHRNVFGLAFHPITKDLFITENGEATDDELNILYKGRDYGWPVTVGYRKFAVSEDEYKHYNLEPDNYVKPIWSSGRNTIAPTQMIFYNGSRYEEFINQLFFLTVNDSALNRIILDENYKRIVESHVYRLDMPLPTDIEVDKSGNIYVAGINDKIYRVDFNKIINANRDDSKIIIDMPKLIDKDREITINARIVDSNGMPLSYKPINFRLDGYIIATVRSNAEGYARLDYHFNDNSLHNLSVEFEGDDAYSPSNATARFVVSDKKDIITYIIPLNDNLDARVSIMPMLSDSELNVDTSIIYIVELLDNNKPFKADYKFKIVNEDGILLEEDAHGSSLHIYKFDKAESIRVIVEYQGLENYINLRVVPEFGIYALLAFTLSIALMIFYICRGWDLNPRTPEGRDHPC